MGKRGVGASPPLSRLSRDANNADAKQRRLGATYLGMCMYRYVPAYCSNNSAQGSRLGSIMCAIHLKLPPRIQRVHPIGLSSNLG